MRPRAIAATRVSRGTSRQERESGPAPLTGLPNIAHAFHDRVFPLSDVWLKGRRGSNPRAAASFRAISAARLNVSQRSHLRPIHVVVCDGPQRRPHLGEGFALRCPQRLSRPDAATRLRAWRHDRHTVGPSVPVLSY